MNLATALLYPVLLLLPAAGATDVAPGQGAVSGRDAGPGSGPVSDGVQGRAERKPVEIPPAAYVWPSYELPAYSTASPIAARLLRDALPQDAWQIRIEQRMTIRITPRATMPLPDMLVGMPGGDGVPQLTERKIGKCLSIAGIASVRPDRANRLLLFMRDRRVVSAELDRSCRARDFYSGFLLEPSEDGRICVDRDTLLSRNGMNCKLTRIRELIEQDH
ncbi:hypothetical protein [Novosphingobium sp. BL-52-GroH]|uniref:hypothetical protein n=1 Tax=Novosphingobium sp. BL-52-GroH TaxID=3349877 RepID=UPI00384AA1CA